MTDKHLQISVCSSWTNEKHLQFLSSVEASFVRTMLDGNGGNCLLRLDRYIPDSSESTQDCLKSKRKKKLHPTGDPKILALTIKEKIECTYKKLCNREWLTYS